jgi:hypothetical protein
VIVSDLEMARRVRKGSIEEAVEDVCSRVGYNHQPYIWLETVCEEIIDEKLGRDNYTFMCPANQLIMLSMIVLLYSILNSPYRLHIHTRIFWCLVVCHADDIVGATKFREKLLKGGFNPDQSYPDAVCDELYKCSSKKETEEL